ncbi:MAG: hypothetical protein UU14_C0011G0022 [Candidatus Roizmanbacteria bacterium GW2011_GWB1_40_7]|uniref:Uncharacterized protein n=1 Tax=Candidatus Roizmanbacteria bacterium GW2011_GWB1_40_7 TaxID=1618482 RepID=A0A0G0WAA5_9BACT|nr:MAG: hypothetical protein UU14_C0011G0022 [Candidatus Roizmanbacteria bacterium GW2011_GWB1_40_7]
MFAKIVINLPLSPNLRQFPCLVHFGKYRLVPPFANLYRLRARNRYAIALRAGHPQTYVCGFRYLVITLAKLTKFQLFARM